MYRWFPKPLHVLTLFSYFASQGDGVPAQEKKSTVTLNRNEITDTEGYSDLPAHAVSFLKVVCGQV